MCCLVSCSPLPIRVDMAPSSRFSTLAVGLVAVPLWLASTAKADGQAVTLTLQGAQPAAQTADDYICATMDCKY